MGRGGTQTRHNQGARDVRPSKRSAQDRLLILGPVGSRPHFRTRSQEPPPAVARPPAASSWGPAPPHPSLQGPLLLPPQVKRPTCRGSYDSAPRLLCASLGPSETLRHPPLLSLAHARLLVAAAESRACQEPCLGATSNDKTRMRARGWHMVLISSQVYLQPLNISRPAPVVLPAEHPLSHTPSPDQEPPTPPTNKSDAFCLFAFLSGPHTQHSPPRSSFVPESRSSPAEACRNWMIFSQTGLWN